MRIDVKHLAKLARLRIEDDELPKFEKDMESIVSMVEQLSQPKTEVVGLDPEHPMKLRGDVESDVKFTRNELLANAPKTQNGCVVVPKTVE